MATTVRRNVLPLSSPPVLAGTTRTGRTGLLQKTLSRCCWPSGHNTPRLPGMLNCWVCHVGGVGVTASLWKSAVGAPRHRDGDSLYRRGHVELGPVAPIHVPGQFHNLFLGAKHRSSEDDGRTPRLHPQNLGLEAVKRDGHDSSFGLHRVNVVSRSQEFPQRAGEVVLQQVWKALCRHVNVFNGERLALRHPQPLQKMDPASGRYVEHLGDERVRVQRASRQHRGSATNAPRRGLRYTYPSSMRVSTAWRAVIRLMSYRSLRTRSDGTDP